MERSGDPCGRPGGGVWLLNLTRSGDPCGRPGVGFGSGSGVCGIFGEGSKFASHRCAISYISVPFLGILFLGVGFD